jgi:hypothetical protein
MHHFLARISLLLSGTTFLLAQSTDSTTSAQQMHGGYNASAQMETAGVGMYASADFIYWQASEDDMEVATILQKPTSTTGLYREVDFDLKFKPGFKICVGGNLDYDNWDVFAEYTWFHTGKMTTSIRTDGTLIGADSLFSTDGPLLSSRMLGNLFLTNELLSIGDFAKRTWNLKMDFLDLMLARSYTVGSKLNVRPSFGGRAAWIRQYMTQLMISDEPFFRSTLLQNPDFISNNKTISWGLGLKGACQGDWLLGSGCRIFGYSALDLLFTRYSLSNSTLNSSIALFSNKTFQGPIYVIRPHVELELGFGYGTHFHQDQCYFDVSAAYGFQVFWNQNMFLENTLSSLPADELNIHGLRLSLLFAY